MPCLTAIEGFQSSTRLSPFIDCVPVSMTMKGLQTLWGLRSFIIVLVLLTHTPTFYGAERIRNGRNSSNGQDERSLQRKRNNNRTPSPHRQRTSSQHLINSLTVAQQPTNHHHHHIEDQHTEFVKGKNLQRERLVNNGKASRKNSCRLDKAYYMRVCPFIVIRTYLVCAITRPHSSLLFVRA
ncbi:hypothetical protein GQX74_011850 [Glossina fuscipes]|nr:hypothetical protein GQX74_011850 [Glossina fuscipes]